MAQNDRFIRAYAKGIATVNEIWIDRETGVNYFFHQSGYGPDSRRYSIRKASPSSPTRIRWNTPTTADANRRKYPQSRTGGDYHRFPVFMRG